MPARIWTLPISAVIIAGLCAYKWSRDYDAVDVGATTESSCMATAFKFELSDQNNERVRLERYLSRHRILLVFFDGAAGAERDPVLIMLRERFSQVKRKRIIVLGVSTAIPQHNRPLRRIRSRPAPNQTQRPFPFELLTDASRTSDIHRLWGRYDRLNKRPTTGTFLIDRAGRVKCENGVPKPLRDPEQTIDEMLAG